MYINKRDTTMTTKDLDFGPLYRAYTALDLAADTLLDRDPDKAMADAMIPLLTEYAEAHIRLARDVNSNDAIALHDRGAGQALIAATILRADPSDISWCGYLGSAQAQYEKMFSAGYGAHPLNDSDDEGDPGVVTVTFE